MPSAMEFTEVTGSLNPLNGVDVGWHSTIAFLDANGDGLPDAFIGEEDGNINYFENTGTSDSAAFTERTGSLNPLNGVDVFRGSNMAKGKEERQKKEACVDSEARRRREVEMTVARLARRANENGGSFSYVNPVGEGGGEERIDLRVGGGVEEAKI